MAYSYRFASWFVRHRSSLPALKEKLNQIPKGLDKLFDKMFNDIIPADRRRSDRMLMLAASKGAVNALLYSWLEDLEDPEFPYDASIEAYSDDEINSRHISVLAQLDSLSRGLLEMKPSRWSHPKAGRQMTYKDIYFRYEVNFFHRSVLDYLTEPVRYASIKNRLMDFDTTQAYQRLVLAEFKFARAMNSYFRHLELLVSENALRSCFSKLSRDCSPSKESPPKILDECGRVLEHHKQDPFPYPDETIQNTGSISWSHTYNAKYGYFYESYFDISYPHWLAFSGHQNYVMTRFMLTEELKTPVSELSLLFTSSIRPHEDNLCLVCDLLKHGSSPNHQITVTSIDGTEEKRATTVWAAFLFVMCEEVSSLRRPKSQFIHPHRSLKVTRFFFLILEEYLRSGADNDVCFFFDNYTKAATNESVEMIMVTLEDVIIMEQPPNSDRLLKLASRGKGSPVWNGTKQLLSKLKPWMRGSIGAEQNCRKARLDDMLTKTN